MRNRLVIIVVAALVVAAGSVAAAIAGGKSEGGFGHDRAHGIGHHGGHVLADLPDRLELPDGWRPEGITANGKALYVGSIPTGAVLRLQPHSGRYKTVVPGGTGRAAVGLKIDHAKRLFVAGGQTGKAFIYDARDGSEIAQLQLSQPGAETFVNDVVLTKTGAYFTDSRRSAIYRVTGNDQAHTIELPSIPLEASNNLNGIVATRDGTTLFAVQTNAGRLWRIDARTGAAAQVDLGGASLVNGDGMLLAGRTLYVLQNRLNQIAVVRLNAGGTAGAIVTTIKSTSFDVPSTMTFLRGELYAVNARFGTATPESADYWVTRVIR